MKKSLDRNENPCSVGITKQELGTVILEKLRTHRYVDVTIKRHEDEFQIHTTKKDRYNVKDI